MKFALPTALLLFSAPAALANPLPIAQSFYVYGQDFNSLPNAANNAGALTRWSDGVTLPGWYAYKAGSASQIGGFDGASRAWYVADGALAPNVLPLAFATYSLGTNATTERSLGSAASSASGEISQMVVFLNQRSYALKLRNIGYRARAFRKNSGFNPETISVSVKTAASLADLQTGITTEETSFGRQLSGWRSLPEAQATFPMDEVSGNGLPMTQLLPPRLVELFSIQPTMDVLVPPGNVIAVRFGNQNDDGTDGLLGIDDLRLEFGEVPCDLFASVTTNVVRNTGTTPENPADDTIDFTAAINASGTFSTAGYDILSPASVAGTRIAYGNKSFAIPISAFPELGDHGLTLQIRDSANPSCQTTLRIVPPWCSQTVKVVSIDASSTGSTYSATVLVTGEYVGTSYTLGTQTGQYGTPLVVTGIAATGNTTRLLTDLGDPRCRRNVSFFPRRTLGEDAINNQPMFAELLAAPADWVVDSTAKTSTLNAAGAETGTALSSATMQVGQASGIMRFTAVLDVSENSLAGNFETADQFRALLYLDEGLPTASIVNLIEPYDRNAYEFPPGIGWLTGYTDSSSRPYDDNRQLDEFNKDGDGGERGVEKAGSLAASFPLRALLPDTVSTVRFEISGDNDSADEFYVVKQAKLEIVLPNLIVSTPQNLIRIENGPGIADDQVSFDLSIDNEVAGTGWTSNRAPSSGAFGTVRFTMSVNENSIQITDVDHPALVKVIPVDIPARYTIGTNRTAGEVPIYTKADTAPPAEWVNNASARTLSLSNSGGAEKVVLSEVLNVSGLTGDLEISAVLEATDVSGASNFEANDFFRAELILDGNTAQPVSLIRPVWDRNEFSTAKVGYLNGYDDNDDFPYNEYRTRDEFNRGQTAPFDFGVYSTSDRNWTARFEMSQPIPDAVQTVQIRIMGANNNPSETFVVKNIVLTGSSADSDRDGMSDSYEQQNGLNPSDPDDGESDLDGDGKSNLAEFLAGTPANQYDPTLLIKQITLNPADNTLRIVFPASGGRNYRLASAEHLTGPWTLHTPFTPTSNGDFTSTIPRSAVGNGIRGFVRVQLVP